MSDEIVPPDVSALETTLAALRPQADFDRDALMFRAGQASARRSRWIAPAVAAASTLLAVALGTLLVLRPPAERVVYIHVDKAETPQPMAHAGPARPTPEVARSAYVTIRTQVLHHGVESLPPPPAVPPAPKSAGRLDLSDL
jgi:hypothetical protein